jgi:hypothetical protein
MPDERGTKVYQIQVGAYANDRNVQDAMSRLQRNGLHPATERFRNLTRVMIRGIPANQIRNFLVIIGRAGFSEVIIREDTSCPAPAPVPVPVAPPPPPTPLPQALPPQVIVPIPAPDPAPFIEEEELPVFTDFDELEIFTDPEPEPEFEPEPEPVFVPAAQESRSDRMTLRVIISGDEE